MMLPHSGQDGTECFVQVSAETGPCQAHLTLPLDRKLSIFRLDGLSRLLTYIHIDSSSKSATTHSSRTSRDLRYGIQ
jgi:hypothetical protein